MKRTTIKDIAEMLGVNISTVSRALSGHPDVGEEMRTTIKNLAEKLNYHPNSQAINFRKQKSRLIGLIIPEISSFFFPSVIKAIENMAHTRGYNLLVLQSNDDLQREIENIRVCYDNRVEGLLVSVSKNTFTIDHFFPLINEKIPVVFFDKVLPSNNIHKVMIDDRQATMKAIDYLASTGCTSIWGLFGNPNFSITQMRLQGFRDALLAAGLPYNFHRLKFAGSSEEAKKIVMEVYEQEKPDAFFAMSDEILIGMAAGLRELKVNVPQECSIIGISDGFLPHFLDPKITYIKHSGYEVGSQAVSRLCDLIEGKVGFASLDIFVETELVVQNSTR